jgi:hypothetical protein
MASEDEKKIAETVARTELDEWWLDFKAAPLSPAENIELGMRWLQPPFEVAYEDQPTK